MRAYFGDGGTRQEFGRTDSHGYISLVVDEGVTMPCYIELTGEGSSLNILRVDLEDAPESDEYTFMCKEFGLFDFSHLDTKVSIIFCDDGWMLVTLLEGALAIEYNGDVLIPSTVGYEKCKCDLDRVLWVNQDYLLEHKQFWGDKYECMCIQDFEYIFQLSGGLDAHNCSSFRLKHLNDEYKDLSRGYTQACRNKDIQRAKIEEAQRVMQAALERDTSGGLDLDGEEEYQASRELDFEYEGEDEGEEW